MPMDYPTPAACELRGGQRDTGEPTTESATLRIQQGRIKMKKLGSDKKWYSINVAESNKYFVEMLAVMTDNIPPLPLFFPLNF